ncbi:MAG TPA: glutathione S-transferase N-terminal domain-containing protein [Acidiferrobacteraceae bacterium]|nr:glutathione S-transferase N-terminal domain-containing protein [Acidiferrobacteraceae bacterium]
MKLYGSLTSPYVRKVRICLKEKGIACEFIVEDPWSDKTITPTLNPLGKVPVLVLDHQKSLYDSALIVDYLDSLGGDRLIPADGDARWDVLRWHALSHGILDAVVARLMESRRSAEQQSSKLMARQESKIARALEAADSADKGRAYLIGERFTLADLSLGLALEYIDFRYPHDWRSRHPRLAQWLAGMSRRASFAETVPPGMERALDAPH